MKRSFNIETWTMWRSCSLILLITLRMYSQYAVTGACLCTTRTNGSVPSCAAVSGMDQPCHPNWKCNDRKVYVMSASCWACQFEKCLQKHEGLVSGTSLPNSVHYYDSGYMAYLGRSHPFQFVWLVPESLKRGSRVRFLLTWVQFTSGVCFLFHVYIDRPQIN